MQKNHEFFCQKEDDKISSSLFHFFFSLSQWLQAIDQVSTVKVWNKSKSLLLQIAKLPKLLNIKYLASDRVQFEHDFNQTLLLLSVEGRIYFIQALLLRI